MIGSGNTNAEEARRKGVRMENKLGKMSSDNRRPRLTSTGECKSGQQDNQMDSGFMSGTSLLSSSSLCSEELTSSSRDADFSLSSKSHHHHHHPQDESHHHHSIGPKTYGSEILDSGIDLSERISSLNLSTSSGSSHHHVSPTPGASVTTEKSPATVLAAGSSPSSDAVTEAPRNKLANLHITILREIFRKDADGDTQLHVAVVRGFVEVVYHITRLLPHQALLDIPNNAGRTALHLAVSSGDARLARHLIVCGASPVAKNRRGDTPLHLACRTGDPDMISGLTSQVTVLEVMSARVSYPPNHTPGLLAADLSNYDGQTCLHIAAVFGQKQVLQHLTWYGADVNAKDGKCGRTPLHYAVEARNKDLARFLVNSCRAALSIMNYAGLTPYQLAVANDAPEMACLLEELGAKKDPLPASFDEDLDYEEDSSSFEVDEDYPWSVDDIRIGGMSQVPLQYSNPIPVSSHSPINADGFL